MRIFENIIEITISCGQRTISILLNMKNFISLHQYTNCDKFVHFLRLCNGLSLNEITNYALQFSR